MTPTLPSAGRPFLVQKFGGSSVASAEGQGHLLDHVRRALEEGFHPCLVVSAMGRRPAPYATDSLLDLVGFAAEVADRRELDMLMACGETLAVVVVAHLLRKSGIPAAALAGLGTGFCTDSQHGEARIEQVDPSWMLKVAAEGMVPVVAGFQGVAADGSITTLGRGGSDTSAVAVAIALGAQAVEIFSDVEGVMTVDPRVYERAALVRRLTYEELWEMAVEGARVMHPRSVDLAGGHGMPMRVRSTFLRAPGTEVVTSLPPDALERQRVVTSLTTVAPVARVVAACGALDDADGVRASLLESLAARGVSLDLINICRGDLVFVVKQEVLGQVRQHLESAGVDYDLRPGCAKIAVVGVGMRGIAGVMARVQRALHRASIPLLHSTDSNITLSCLVDQVHLPQAIAVLHDEFRMGEPHGS